ncbi:MAG: methylmalonyl-CoA mutase family protein [Candidatus Marinimicrobia bacterium]|nr:methylmalonyl-CoA mutase family protein [Candidatus Neomarinimicrobiota bacterium]MCF7827892.1 methylmalonyl-CoA mutase family protein [Candidatus Neomarinimicrobiota bacterium]MCF7879353.1 methylmalonyl-CoA mutase family protein [Candidatus Neomarinimicrobiota bacterium]
MTSNSKSQWKRETLHPALERYPERKEKFTPSSNIEIKRLYTPDPEFDYHEQLGYPGEFPYTRGVQPTMYRGKLWTMRQYAGFASAEESNKRYKYLLKQGTKGLSVAFDLPTQIGYDSDHELAEGEVGRVGVPISSLRDMEVLFDGIPLDEVSTSMTINSTAPILLALYIAVAEQQGVPSEKLRGTVQNDILKEYIARGTYIYPPEHSMRLVTDIFEYCEDNLPKWNTISISGYHIREAGATAAQELAFTVANGLAYVDAAIDRGLDVNTFGAHLSFFFNAHNNFFEEIAKFRAARRLWARLMTERYDVTNPRAMQVRFHTQTGGSTLTAQQMENNVARTTIQALAAVLGGTQSLHTNGKDEAVGLPTEESARTAIRTQQILAHESGVADTVDPLAGSYFVESLTDDIEEQAREILGEVEELGGAVNAVESGYFQREIGKSAYRYQQEVEKGEQIVVGVNKYAEENDPEPDILQIDPEQTQRQIDRLQSVKWERDAERVQTSLEKIRRMADSDENLMPAILEGVKSYATLGEISNVLREVFGEYESANY